VIKIVSGGLLYCCCAESRTTLGDMGASFGWLACAWVGGDPAVEHLRWRLLLQAQHS
jgi:hypothetical protein